MTPRIFNITGFRICQKVFGNGFKTKKTTTPEWRQETNHSHWHQLKTDPNCYRHVCLWAACVLMLLRLLQSNIRTTEPFLPGQAFQLWRTLSQSCLTDWMDIKKTWPMWTTDTDLALLSVYLQVFIDRTLCLKPKMTVNKSWKTQLSSDKPGQRSHQWSSLNALTFSLTCCNRFFFFLIMFWNWIFA